MAMPLSRPSSVSVSARSRLISGSTRPNASPSTQLNARMISRVASRYFLRLKLAIAFLQGGSEEGLYQRQGSLRTDGTAVVFTRQPPDLPAQPTQLVFHSHQTVRQRERPLVFACPIPGSHEYQARHGEPGNLRTFRPIQQWRLETDRGAEHAWLDVLR